MTADIMNGLQAIGSLLVGMVGRAGLALLAGLALAAPALVLALVWRAMRGGRAEGMESTARVAPNHTWVALRRDGALIVGVDEVAEKILPSATAVELPRPGMQVTRGDPIAVIRAGRRAVRIGAPVDGTIVGVNRRVRRDPTIVKDDPYGRGWLFRIVPRDDAWRRLPSGPVAVAWVAAERRRLARFVEEELGLAAADGGELVAPAPALLGEHGWRRVVASFLEAA